MIKCDRCGREMNDSWRLLSKPGDGMDTRFGGNCPACGDDLCADCAGEWAEKNGESVCEQCWSAELRKGKKDDAGKLRWDLLPWRELEKVVEVLTYGANKYADNNWKKVTPLKERYTGALMRHFVAWQKGEQLDEESGLYHLAQVATNSLFLLWWELEQHGNTKRG